MIRLSFVLACVFVAGNSAAQSAQGPTPAPKKSAKIIQVGSSERPKSFLGVGVREVDEAVAKEKKLPEESGVEVTRVVEDTAASKAGLQKGDILLEYNSQPVLGIEQFIRLVRETPAGRKVTLKISREGSTQMVGLTMGMCEKCGSLITWTGKDFDDMSIEIPQPPSSPEVWVPGAGRFMDTPHVFTTWKSSKLGIEAETLESQLADFFGVKEGILVRNVTKGSAAEKAGLKAGDVITKVGDTPVSKPRDISRAMRESSTTEIPFTIVREKKENTVSVTVERNPSGDGGIQRLISGDSMHL